MKVLVLVIMYFNTALYTQCFSFGLFVFLLIWNVRQRKRQLPQTQRLIVEIGPGEVYRAPILLVEHFDWLWEIIRLFEQVDLSPLTRLVNVPRVMVGEQRRQQVLGAALHVM